jgi:serine/threonine protein phosphatase PrpC
MKCPDCGQENRDVAHFCQHCGASLVAAESPDALPEETFLPDIEGAPEPPTAPVAESPAPSEKDVQEAPESRPAWETAVQEPDREMPDRGPESDEGKTSATETADTEAALTPDVDGAESDAAEERMPEPEGAGLSDDDAHAGNRILGGHAFGEPYEKTSPEVNMADETGDQEPDQPYKDTELVSEEWANEPKQGPDLETSGPAGLEPIPSEWTPPGEGAEPSAAPEGSSVPDEPLTSVEDLVAAEMLPWRDRPEPTQASFQAIEPGTVVSGRYQVIEVLQAEEEEAWYRVRDLQQCPRCGFTENSPDEAFCASCGALMEQKPVMMMLERATKGDDEPAEAQAGEYLQHKGRHYWVWQEMEQEPIKDRQPLMRLTLGQKSDTGQVRELDEDSLFVLTMSSTYESVTHQLGLFVVADGMGGHEGGEMASRLAIQSLAQALLYDVFSSELEGNSLSADAMLNHMESAMRAANDRVYLERQKRENDMGTTLTVALVVDWTLYLAHVGDCRAYVWGQDGLQQLTTDHSIVAGMVAAGTIGPEEIYDHPQRSVIYRSVGDRPTVEVDLSTIALNPDERLVLCCDGLWEMIRNKGIEDILLRESDPQTACDMMVEQANLAGGSDNISVIIVQL